MRASEKNFAFGWGFTWVFALSILVTGKWHLKPDTLLGSLIWLGTVVGASLLAGEWVKRYHEKQEEHFVFHKRVEWYLLIENRVLGYEANGEDCTELLRTATGRFGNFTFTPRQYSDPDSYIQAG